MDSSGLGYVTGWGIPVNNNWVVYSLTTFRLEVLFGVE